MAQLMVRNLPDELLRTLKQRAAKRNRSAEQQHREILKAALKGPQRKPLADVLGAVFASPIPRIHSANRSPRRR